MDWLKRGDLASHEGWHGSITIKKSEQKDDRVTAAVLFQLVSDDLVFILSFSSRVCVVPMAVGVLRGIGRRVCKSRGSAI